MGSSSTLIRQVTLNLDALGRETNFFDTMLTGVTQYDRNSNRRRRLAQVMQGKEVVQSDDNIYLYDAADRPTAVDCGWVLGNVILIKSSSMLITYQEGLRWQEVTKDGTRTIGYWDDGDIAQIRDTDKSVTPTITIEQTTGPGRRKRTRRMIRTRPISSVVTLICFKPIKSLCLRMAMMTPR
ncbi:MAG: hypothetical protein JSR33_10115 [Proteobacteria bacterium]|nr:hypothetical protein [Pseudomonadota bacterium]